MSSGLDKYHEEPEEESLTNRQIDNVNNPKHYTNGSLEVIDILKDQMTKEQFKGFLKGNCFKYLARYELKNGLEDLQKCSWYLERLKAEEGGS